jgi:hypothetical protein
MCELGFARLHTVFSALVAYKSNDARYTIMIRERRQKTPQLGKL